MTQLPHQRPPSSELAQGALSEIEQVSEQILGAIGDGAGSEDLRTAVGALRDRARHLAGNVEKMAKWGGGGAGLHGGGAGETALARLAHLLVRAQRAADDLSQRPADVAAAIDGLTAAEPWPVRLGDREERALSAVIDS